MTPSAAAGWDDSADVVVVGFGAAGACAAVEAADAGATVVALDRLGGGGATARSGGTIYLGGGTALQRELGFDDDAERMLAYLRAETGGAVDEQRLRAFCAESAETYRWLEGLGLRFPPRFFAGKTTHPPDGHGLYYSGNEKQRAPAGEAAAAPPRGHVPTQSGMAGPVLHRAVRRAALERGVELRPYSRVVALVTGDGGRVEGVEVRALPRAAGPPYERWLDGAALLGRGLLRAAEPLERALGRRYRLRARCGVVLAAGGFVFNAQMMRRHAPTHARCMPLGTAGDDGSGILLGQRVGAAVDALDECTAWRFIYPPEAFLAGVLVNSAGERICDESLYGATMSRHIARQPDGRAWLIIDADVARRAREQIAQEPRLRDQPPGKLLSGELNALVFRKLSTALNLHVNRKQARTVAGLARACGLPPQRLERTIADHNAAIERGLPDATGKHEGHRRAIRRPPLRAINCDLDNRLFLGPCITLGGLRTDPVSAAVLRPDGSTIDGLYAAGRTAVGICAGGYVSGLSIADGIYSGRHAGRHAAAAA